MIGVLSGMNGVEPRRGSDGDVARPTREVASSYRFFIISFSSAADMYVCIDSVLGGAAGDGEARLAFEAEGT
jgi:hypothetical protein